jgi:hypothetical protein
VHIAGSPENVADGWLPLERAPARTPTSVGFQVAFASEPNSTLAGGTACILSLSEHATFARLIHCMAAAELGNRQSFTKAERCHARAAFFMEVGARLLNGTGMESK